MGTPLLLRENGRDDGSEFLGEARRALLARLVPPLVHRLNNALAVVHGARELAVEAGAGSPAEREFVHARRALQHLATLAKSTPPRRESVDLGATLDAIETLLGPLAEAHRVPLELVRPKGVAALRTDPARLEQLLVVLVAGELLALAEAASPRLRLRLAPSGRAAALTITRPRLGPGDGAVPEDAAWRAAVAWAEAEGVSVSLRALGGAFCFRLVFPAALEAPAPEPSLGGRLLLVEQDDTLRELIGAVLTEVGYRVEVHAASDVDLDELASSAADLLLIDADHQLGWPGFVDELALRDGLVGRVLLLGEPSRGEADVPVLQKPFRPQELIEAVRVLT